jgi:hypothetical protein
MAILADFFKAKTNVSAALLGAAMIDGLTRISSLLPSEFYFTFEDVLNNPNPKTHWISLLAKLLIPIFVGLVLGYIWRDDGKIAAAVGGFCGPFLTMWPFLAHWGDIAPDPIRGDFYAFVSLYCMYTVASIYLCMTGALIGAYLARSFIFVAGDPIVISLREVIRTGTIGLFAFLSGEIFHLIFDHTVH